jgi:hypothetical protein
MLPRRFGLPLARRFRLDLRGTAVLQPTTSSAAALIGEHFALFSLQNAYQ